MQLIHHVLFMKKDGLLELPLEELKLRLQDAQLELSNLRFQQATHQIDNPLKIRTIRREIARIKTFMREYELSIRKTRTKQV